MHVVGFVDGGGIVGLGAELIHGVDVFEGFFDGEEGLDGGADGLHFLDDFLRGILVVPEVRRRSFFLRVL